MKKPKMVKSAFASYSVTRSIGQGGNGYVYEGTDGSENVAIKILDKDRATSEKLKRFKNEFKFCSIERHPNIIKVLDHGLADNGSPFFTMPMYEGSIREILGSLEEEQCFKVVTKILNGLEASHKLGVTHRDLKPENILFSRNSQDIDAVLADFGIAEFGIEELYTAVETKDGSRLANFQYAAPEQRIRNGVINKTTDIYSAGLIINELFTKELALGKNHKLISEVSEKYRFLDGIVDRMLQQERSRRYQNIDEIKLEISVRLREYQSSLKLSKLTNTVIPEGDIDDPIVQDPMRIVDVVWEKGTLIIHLNHNTNQKWVWAINNMGRHSAVWGKGPESFNFIGNKATISASDKNDAQQIIDYFNQWLSTVAIVYENRLKQDIENEKREKIRIVEQRIAEEEKNISINSSLRF